MEIIIDNIALWRPKINDEFTIRTSAIGTPYKDKDGNAKVARKPIYRYAKSFTVKDGEEELGFSLFVRTLSTDSKAAEKRLDDVAKTITPEQARSAVLEPSYSAFRYLNVYLED